jgi:hypothetical protein
VLCGKRLLHNKNCLIKAKTFHSEVIRVFMDPYWDLSRPTSIVTDVTDKNTN